MKMFRIKSRLLWTDEPSKNLQDKLNDLNLSGYGDYEARVDNVHKFKPSDLENATRWPIDVIERSRVFKMDGHERHRERRTRSLGKGSCKGNRDEVERDSQSTQRAFGKVYQ